MIVGGDDVGWWWSGVVGEFGGGSWWILAGGGGGCECSVFFFGREKKSGRERALFCFADLFFFTCKIDFSRPFFSIFSSFFRGKTS